MARKPRCKSKRMKMEIKDEGSPQLPTAYGLIGTAVLNAVL